MSGYGGDTSKMNEKYLGYDLKEDWKKIKRLIMRNITLKNRTIGTSNYHCFYPLVLLPTGAPARLRFFQREALTTEDFSRERFPRLR